MTHISHIEHSLEMRGPRKRAPHIWRAVCNMLSACESVNKSQIQRKIRFRPTSDVASLASC